MISLIIKAILIGLCGILWRMGGAEGYPKAYRRIGCALVISLSNLWIGVISLPLLIGSFSLGYGESSKLSRWLKNKYLVRLTCGLAYSVASLPILWGNWWLFEFHIGLVSIGVMLAGNQRFQFEDKREEFFIGLITGLCPIM